MATTRKPVDAVLVGFGWTGAIMGQELCEAGLNVLALERGPWRDTATDFATGFAQDELRYMWRHHLFQNVAYDTLTIATTRVSTRCRCGTSVPSCSAPALVVAVCTGTARSGGSCRPT